MHITLDTLSRRSFSHASTTHDTDLVTLHFERGPRISVLKTDPAVHQLRRGDHVTLDAPNKRVTKHGLSVSIFSIAKVERNTPVYVYGTSVSSEFALA